MVASRVLTSSRRIHERHGRLKHLQRLISLNPQPAQIRCLSIGSQGFVSGNAGSRGVNLLLFKRNVSSSARMLQVPADAPPPHEEKKKSILGLDFLSKLFQRHQEPPPPAATAPEAEEAYEASEELQETTEEESAILEVEGSQKYTQEHAHESAVEAAECGNSVQETESSIHGAVQEAESSIQEAENVAVEEVNGGQEEVKLGLEEVESGLDEVTGGAEEVHSGLVKPVKAQTDISASVQDFIKALPPLDIPAASADVPAASSTPAPAKAKPAEAEKPAAKQVVKEPVKPVKKVTSGKPTETTQQGTVPEPVFEFLRSKIRENNANAAEKAAEALKAKLSPRFEALSSSSAEKTTAAINMLLETVDKSAKAQSPAAPIFDALDALEAKQESTEATKESKEPSTGTHTPSLKLSLSTPHAEPPPMDAQTLVTEMNTRLTDGKIKEAAELFEDWRSSINQMTMECNKPDRTLYNLYMQAKLKLGADYEELSEVVSEMEEAGLPRDLAGYNILIRALFRKKDSGTAEKLLERMEKEEPQAQPDPDSYNLVVVLCALDRKVLTATKYMKTMIDKGFEPSRTTVNEVLLASARSHQTQLAGSLLKELKASGKLPMPMLNTCAELLMAASEIDDAECARFALSAISERPMAKFGPKMILDEGTMICVLGTAARTGDTVLCNNAWESLWNHTRGLGRNPSPEAYLARIHALSLSGDITTAFKAVWEFELAHGKKGDVDSEAFSPFTSLRSLACACSRGGAAALDAAYYRLEEAHNKKQGVALAAINCVIMGCANLWDSERAFQTFEAIENTFGLRPDINSCNALLHALGRTKMTEDALKVYDYIKEAGFKPDKWTYMLLCDAHVVNKDSNAALDVLQNMMDVGYLPFRQTTLKVWTRCKHHEDTNGLERLRKMELDLNYRHCYFADARRKLLLDVIKS